MSYFTAEYSKLVTESGSQSKFQCLLSKVWIFVVLAIACFLITIHYLSVTSVVHYKQLPTNNSYSGTVLKLLKNGITKLTRRKQKPAPKNKLVVTRLWAGPNVKTMWEQKEKHLCKYTQCTFTSEMSLRPKADAVVLYSTFLSKNMLPKVRYSWQTYIFFSHEPPPLTTGNLHPWANVFNYTMSYRLDSDIPFPFGAIYNRTREYTYSPVDLYSLSNGKTKLIAWFVGNCHTSSQRETYVRKLQEYVPVDIYGRCSDGKFKCPKVTNRYTKCEDLLNTTYKFYLAFENSVCKDWITEKFWLRIFAHVVPVVLRRSEYIGRAPMSSFIAVDDFKNAKELANYLLYLDKNMTAYTEHFEWKKYAYSKYLHFNKFMCKVCTELHERNLPQQSYKDIHSWWHGKAHCINNYVSKFLQ